MVDTLIYPHIIDIMKQEGESNKNLLVLQMDMEPPHFAASARHFLMTIFRGIGWDGEDLLDTQQGLQKVFYT